jgi:hypothetical protein
MRHIFWTAGKTAAKKYGLCVLYVISRTDPYSGYLAEVLQVPVCRLGIHGGNTACIAKAQGARGDSGRTWHWGPALRWTGLESICCFMMLTTWNTSRMLFYPWRTQPLLQGTRGHSGGHNTKGRRRGKSCFMHVICCFVITESCHVISGLSVGHPLIIH